MLWTEFTAEITDMVPAAEPSSSEFEAPHSRAQLADASRPAPSDKTSGWQMGGTGGRVLGFT